MDFCAVIHPDRDGTYGVSYAGCTVVKEETLAIANAVSRFVNNPSELDNSECADIAAVILHHYANNSEGLPMDHEHILTRDGDKLVCQVCSFEEHIDGVYRGMIDGMS